MSIQIIAFDFSAMDDVCCGLATVWMLCLFLFHFTLAVFFLCLLLRCSSFRFGGTAFCHDAACTLMWSFSSLLPILHTWNVMKHASHWLKQKSICKSAECNDTWLVAWPHDLLHEVNHHHTIIQQQKTHSNYHWALAVPIKIEKRITKRFPIELKRKKATQKEQQVHENPTDLCDTRQRTLYARQWQRQEA